MVTKPMLVSDKMINILDERIMEIPKIAVARGFSLSFFVAFALASLENHTKTYDVIILGCYHLLQLVIAITIAHTQRRAFRRKSNICLTTILNDASKRHVCCFSIETSDDDHHCSRRFRCPSPPSSACDNTSFTLNYAAIVLAANVRS